MQRLQDRCKAGGEYQIKGYFRHGDYLIKEDFPAPDPPITTKLVDPIFVLLAKTTRGETRCGNLSLHKKKAYSVKGITMDKRTERENY